MQAAPTVRDVLGCIGCTLIEVAADEPLDSIARLLIFCGLDAVLLVRPCGAAERIVCARDLADALSGIRVTTASHSTLPRCTPDAPLAMTIHAMLRCDQRALLVEQGDERLAILTLENIAAYMVEWERRAL